MGEMAAVREGFYWEHFDEAERELLGRFGVRPEDADAIDTIDGEVALLRVLVHRLMKAGGKTTDKATAESIARLVERVGRTLRARQALTGGAEDGAVEFLTRISDRVLDDGRDEARKEASR